MIDDAVSFHSEVYRRRGEFAGWPANYGLWAWGEELVCLFATGRVGTNPGLHRENREHPFIPTQARSKDGGLTWSAEAFNATVPGVSTLSADEHVGRALKAQDKIAPANDLRPLETPVDWSDPEQIVLAARTGIEGRPLSWFYLSCDRARSWQGPFAFTGLDLHGGISARTDIVPLGRHDALFMLTTTKRNGREGRVFCARTIDGARTFSLQSFLADEQDGYAIMPASARLSDGSIFTAIRRKGNGNEGWIEAYRSIDHGRSWRIIGRPVADTGHLGNPPALTRLPDDTLVITYGYRNPPYGIRAAVSTDGGRTWPETVVLREDGGGPDLGYPRTALLPDGRLLSVYYFNDCEREERFVAASLFDLRRSTGVHVPAVPCLHGSSVGGVAPRMK